MEAMRKLRKGGAFAEGAISLSSSLTASATLAGCGSAIEGSMLSIAETPQAATVVQETGPLPDGSTLSMDAVGAFELAFGLSVRDTSTSTPTRK